MQLAISHSATYPGHKVSNSKLLEEKDGPAMPADLQVGEYRAAVYTTKIMLALNGVSKQQSQPFMVRVEINIAESKAWGVGWKWASQPQ